jgi:hypothetical protein
MLPIKLSVYTRTIAFVVLTGSLVFVDDWTKSLGAITVSGRRVEITGGLLRTELIPSLLAYVWAPIEPTVGSRAMFLPRAIECIVAFGVLSLASSRRGMASTTPRRLAIVLVASGVLCAVHDYFQVYSGFDTIRRHYLILIGGRLSTTPISLGDTYLVLGSVLCSLVAIHRHLLPVAQRLRGRTAHTTPRAGGW